MVGGQPMPPLKARKAERLLALLALRPGKAVERVWLAGVLWPESTESQGLYNLRRSLTELRKALGPAAERILSPTVHTLCLDPIGLSVDAVAFQDACARADDAAAIAIVTGPFLEGCTEAWAEGPRRAMEDAYAAARRRLCAAARQSGDRDAESRHLRALLRSDPLDETILRRLMEILAAQGAPAGAIEAYQAFRRRLADCLGGVPAQETRALFERISRDPDPNSAPVDGRGLVAPPHIATPLVGRDRLLGELAERLKTQRLVTLVGPGGIGKTRLAIAWAERFADDCCFVDLAPVTRPEALLETVASALLVTTLPGEPLGDAIARRLRTASVPLLCDNAEHLLDSVARWVVDLLAQCPDLRLLITSRVALGLEEEAVVPVPALSLCDPAIRNPEDILARSDAVRLFLDRARHCAPTFTLTPSNAAAVARICAQLDGIPLAIELVASRVGTISCEEMERRLSSELALFTRGGADRNARHRTLEATIQWSFALLSEPDRRLISELSFLIGTFSLEAAEALHGTREGVVEGVMHLVSQSLLAFDPVDRAGRYRMLETVRHFARARIDPEAARACRERHSRYFCHCVEDYGQTMAGIGNPEVLVPLELDRENLREVLRYGDPESRLRLCAAIWPLWFTRGEIAEGRRWLESALEASKDTTSARAVALYAAGSMAIFAGDYGAARAALFKAFEDECSLDNLFGQVRVLNSLGALGIETGNFAEARDALLASRERVLRDPSRRGLAQVLTNLAGVELALANLDEAEDLLQEAIPMLEASRMEGPLALALSNLGEVALHRGNLDQARAHFERADEISERLGFAYGTATVFANLGRCALLGGNLSEALSRLSSALHRWIELRHPTGIAHTIGWLALAALRLKEGEVAAELLGASERMLQDRQVPVLEGQFLVTIASAIQGRLGDHAFQLRRQCGELLDETAIQDRVRRLGATTERSPCPEGKAGSLR